MANLDSVLKSRDITLYIYIYIYIKQRYYFADKGLHNQSYGFSSSHVWMWDLDRKQGWVLKNWCFPTEVLEKTLGSLLDSKEVKPVNPKGNHLWVFIGWTDAEVSTVWPPDANSRLTGKDPDARIDWGQEEKGVTEAEVVGWHQSQWTWVWANPSREWRIGKPDVLKSTGS